MADEKKEDKLNKDEIIKALFETQIKPEAITSNWQQSGIDTTTLIALMISLIKDKEGNEKSIDTLTPLLLMMQQQQKPNPLESLMQMFMISKLIDQMTQKEEDDLTKAFKFKMMMDIMEGSKKESTIDDYIKLLQILNPSRASEIEKLREEFTKINEASQKSMEEMKRTSETNLSQLRSEIITLYKDLISSQQSSSFEEVMKKQLEFQRRVREYAEAMGWIKEMKLPSNKEEWKPEDYINVINKIAEMVKDVMGAMKGIRSSGNPEKAPAVEKMPESKPAQVQEQPVPQPQPAQKPAPATEEEKKLDPELEEYINNMKVTDIGFIDQYGNSYSVQEGRPDINAFKKWAYENPEEVRKHMEQSKEVHEKSLVEKQKAEETIGTGNTSNSNSTTP